ncbi:TPA: hypothetical protein ACKP33_004078 [Serratia marcescens]|nr:hypothetical protein FG173_10125 [Serratia marcescens]
MENYDSFINDLNDTLDGIESMCRYQMTESDLDCFLEVLSGVRLKSTDEALFYSYFLYCGRMLSSAYENYPNVFMFKMDYTRKQINELGFELNKSFLRENPSDMLFYIVMALMEFFIISPFHNLRSVGNSNDYVDCYPVIQGRITEVAAIAKKTFPEAEMRLSYLGFGLVMDVNESRINDLKNGFDNLESSGVRSLLENVVESDEKVKECILNQSAFLQEISVINNKLSEHKSHFNFALLSKAFVNMKKSKEKEKIFAYGRLWIVLLVLFSIPLSLIIFDANSNSLNWSRVFYYIPFVTLELLLFYIMRLFYLEVGSIKAQILQIDIRLSLCEFIHDYIEKREGSDKNSDSWGKFETLIFSPIQMNSDNIPSLLDGASSVADIVGKVMPKK